MLTRTEETDSDASSGTAADSRPVVAEDGGSDSVSNLETVLSDEPPDEPWAIVSLGGHDLEDTAIANNLSGLDINSINQEIGVSSLSGTNGVTFDGQTILSSLGPDADDEDDAIDGLLLPGPNPASTGSVTGENDDLSIPDTIPSNIRSIRGVGVVNATTFRQASSTNQQKHNRKRDTIVLVSFAVLFMGVTVLASTWRRSALRLEAELAELRQLKKVEGRNANVATRTGVAQTNAPPLFGDRDKEEEATPFTFADNCYIKAKASVSLGSCGSEMRDNLQNSSSRIRKRFKSFSRKFEEAFWSFASDDDGDHDGNNSTGTLFSSSSFFSTTRPRNAAGGTSQTFSSFNKFWEAKRNCWSKASKQFASDLNAFANRASESVHQTLNQSNKAIEHGIWSFIDHARDAIEEGTSTLREIKHGEGGEISDPYRGDGTNLMEGFRIIFSNITLVRRIAREIPSLGSAK